MDTMTPSARKRTPPKGGSRKGIPNKITSEVREMIRRALDDAGGVEYLVSVSRSHPQAFLALVSKIVPAEVSITADVSHRDAAAEAVASMMTALFAPPGAPQQPEAKRLQ